MNTGTLLLGRRVAPSLGGSGDPDDTLIPADTTDLANKRTQT
ncbi:MAG: hypothetical protein U0792_07600 [Gemmataceae bacterium]